MKNHRDLVGLGANILIAVLILLIIIAGLNKMGLYNLPEPIEKLLGSDGGDERHQSIDEDRIYNSVDFSAEQNGKVEKIKITHENARKMLEEVVNKNNYRHEVSVSHISDAGTLTREVVLEVKNGEYKAEVFSQTAKLIEAYSEEDGVIYARRYDGDKLAESIAYPKGSFTVPELCSVIANHKSFLDGTYELSDADFAVVHGDFGTELEITFDTSLEGYSQRETYLINVDYGIVTQAECIENEKLVYSMQTMSLKELAN